MARLTTNRGDWSDPDHAAPPHELYAMGQQQGTRGDDNLHGRKTNDTIDGLGGDDVINGRAADDILSGDGGNDVLRGSGGADKLYGGAGDDVLYGGTERKEGPDGSSDRLEGGSGNDLLYGGAGRDILVGGSGADRFMYTKLSDSAFHLPDTIMDFEQGKDKLVFRAAFREAGHLHFIGDAEFSHTAGEVRYEVFPTTTGVLIDMDGDAAPDIRVLFEGPEIQFQASDFSF